MAPEKACTLLPMFHAITGCDTTREFKGKKKKIAGGTWNVFPDVLQAFLFLMSCRHSYS